MARITILALATLNIVISQKSQIEKINIASKKNGLTISIFSDVKIQPSQITGWYNPSTSWSYITVYNARGNIEALNKTFTSDGITALEIIQLNESLQLGLRTTNPIEQFEFYNKSADSIITASLRYPLNQALAYINKKEKDAKTNNKNLATLLKKYMSEVTFLFVLILLMTLGD